MAKADEIENIIRLLDGRSLVFVGMMGCGKSAIGRLVAAELDLPYRDSDSEISAAADLSIPEIFEKFGEDYFRKGEERVVERLLSENPGVLSLGGGAFVSPHTRERIGQSAVSIWLMADPELLMSRIRRRPDSRPLLKTPNPRATLVKLMEERIPIYREADIHVASSKTSKTRTRYDVLAALADWLKQETRDGTAG